MSSPSFRTNYLNRWKNLDSRVVGFLLSGQSNYFYDPTPPEVQLLPTSNLGRNINTRNLFPGSRVGFFISKSPSGGLLLFGGTDPKRFYVCKPTSSSPVELPAPPELYESSMANILCCSDDGADYKVVLAKGYGNKSTLYSGANVSVQTFCSWTWKWEQTTLTFSTPLEIWSYTLAESGTVTSRGVIYWKARKRHGDQPECLAVWDTNGGDISLIPSPPSMDRPTSYFYGVTYGEPPQGSLLAATCCQKRLLIEWESEWFTINICSFDDDKQGWRFLHSVRQESIWSNNLSLLMSLFEARPENEFAVVSFVPGKSDALFLALGGRLFTYHFPSGNLEYVEYMKYGFVNKDQKAYLMTSSYPIIL